MTENNKVYINREINRLSKTFLKQHIALTQQDAKILMTKVLTFTKLSDEVKTNFMEELKRRFIVVIKIQKVIHTTAFKNLVKKIQLEEEKLEINEMMMNCGLMEAS